MTDSSALAADIKHQLANQIAVQAELLNGAASGIRAAEQIESELRACGLQANARGHVDRHGVIVVVFVVAQYRAFERAMEILEIEARIINDLASLAIEARTYDLAYRGEQVKVVVTQRNDAVVLAA